VDLPAVADAELPSTATDAHPLPVPALFGPDAVLALEGLTREQVSFTFEADLSALADLDPGGIDSVYSHLEADPRWRVTRSRDRTRLATLRHVEGDTRSIAQSGYHMSDDHCYRVALRDGGSDPGGWVLSERVAHAEPTAQSKLELHGFRPEGGTCGRLATAAVISGAVNLEVFESGPMDARPITLSVLSEVPYLVSNLSQGREIVRAVGHDPLHLPAGEPLPIDGPTLSVTAAGPQALLVSARVNPGAAGFTWLRLVDGATAAPWHADAIAAGTLERIGYSDDPSRGFYLQSTFGAPAGEAFEGVAELWFQSDGEEPRRLHAQRIEVPAR
jgi:hypothetical protein